MQEWIYKKLLAHLTKKHRRKLLEALDAQKGMRRCEFELDKIERLKVL